MNSLGNSILRLPGLSGLIVFLVAGPTSAQVLEVLHGFDGSDGSGPNGSLVQDASGNLYGTTVAGPGEGRGTVFQLTPSGVFSTLCSFWMTNGADPWTGPAIGPDGALYGATSQGGLTNNAYSARTYGTLFRVTTSGVLTTPVFFDGYNGSMPYSQFLLARDGNFYGTTMDCRCGPVESYGSVFRLTPGGVLTTLHVFNLHDGNAPNGRLVEGSDGALYGVTVWGGPYFPAAPYGSGTIFRITTNGVFTMMAAFDGTTGRPYNLTLAADGNFYGTTLYPATVFKMTQSGALSVLAWLPFGEAPEGGLVQARDGLLYGTDALAGANECGIVFTVSTNGEVRILCSLAGTGASGPFAPLIQGADGNLYGTTYAGGSNNLGVVYRIVFPTLEASLAGDKILVSWPANQTGFVLECSSQLGNSEWAACDVSPAVADGRFWVTSSISSGSIYFRLKK